MQNTFDVVVLGAGVSGLAAAKEASRLGLRTTLVESAIPGGVVVNINHLSPGLEGAGGSGSELAADLMMAVMDAGVEHLMESADSIREVAGAYEIACSESTLRAKAVIVATGAAFKKLGLHGEDEFDGRGISHCADCDGRLYTGKVAVVVGGGDSATQEALVLASICAEVHMVYQGNELSADTELASQIASKTNVVAHPNSVAEEILGDQGVTGLKIRDLGNDEQTSIACAALFPFIGLAPNSGFLPAEISRDAAGGLITDESLRSSMRGIFAAGAVRAGYPGYLADAIGEGKKAAQAAAEHVKTS